MFIGSIDVGTRNLAFAVFNSSTNSIVHMEIIDLSKVDNTVVRVNEQSLVYLVRTMVEKRRRIFELCTIVGIEKQMTRRMLAVQFILECVLYPMVQYVVQIPPANVKRWIGTGCRKNHRKNKKAAVAKLKSMIGEEGRKALAKFKKQDDVADSSLQAMYIHANIKKVLKKWKDCRKPLGCV